MLNQIGRILIYLFLGCVLAAAAVLMVGAGLCAIVDFSIGFSGFQVSDFSMLGLGFVAAGLAVISWYIIKMCLRGMDALKFEKSSTLPEVREHESGQHKDVPHDS